MRLLDLSRLVSRAGQSLTGIDRVEYAYLEYLLDRGQLFGLIRSSFGFLLLDERGCRALLDMLRNKEWGAPDRLSRMKRGLGSERAGLESTLRRMALARCLPATLGRTLRRHLPKGLHYINVGHTNFTARVIRALKSLDARIAVLIHDTIPLDHPQYQRPGTVETFQSFLLRAGAEADLLLCNSRQTEADLHQHLATVPETLVVPLGMDTPRPGTAPEGPWSTRYFVTLGTIEPRKNHAFLLDIWPDVLREVDADLLILGHRGWENHETFARLDARPERIHERSNLSDAEVFALIQGAAGFLFPSLAEGYGLPPMEAAALGTPVVCNDLPIYRETLENIPVYANVNDRYLWIRTIDHLAKDPEGRGGQASEFTPPSWEAHFKVALTRI